MKSTINTSHRGWLLSESRGDRRCSPRHAAEDPCTPNGTDPMSPCIWGYHPANTQQFDVPF
jgi:hypothetical protein